MQKRWTTNSAQGMKKNKIIYIVAIPGSVRTFLAERMHYLAETHEVSAICSPGAEHEQFKEEGLVTHAIPIARRISPLKDIVSLVRLYRFLKQQRPDIVHTMTPKAGLLGTIASWAARVPVRIAMFNGELKLPNRLTCAIVRVTNALTCFFATHLNADGFGTRQYVLEQKITRKPITVFWKGNINGIDLTRFSRKGRRDEMRRSLGINESTLVYIYVGRIVHDKGIDELVPAFARLQQSGVDAALLLVGEEEQHLDPISEKTRQTIHQNQHIYAIGRQRNVPDWLEAADVFILPSHREGCNCSLLEAGAMGLPSIASDILGCRDIIKERINGLLVPSKNPDALHDAMYLLYTSAFLRHQLQEQSRPYVEANFDRKDVWKEMLFFYNQLVTKN